RDEREETRDARRLHFTADGGRDRTRAHRDRRPEARGFRRDLLRGTRDGALQEHVRGERRQPRTERGLVNFTGLEHQRNDRLARRAGMDERHPQAVLQRERALRGNWPPTPRLRARRPRGEERRGDACDAKLHPFNLPACTERVVRWITISLP